MAAERGKIATGTSTGTIKIWNPRTGQPLTMMRIDEPIHDCGWFDDGRGLLVMAEKETYAFTLT
jgi:hypothetical protein